MSVNWNKRKYTEAQFIKSWLSSDSIAECARRLSLTIYGSTYTTLKDTASSLNLNRDHMTGQNWWTKENKPIFPGRTDDQVFVYGKCESTGGMKKRLYKSGVERKCGICGLTEWLGQPAPLSLDHIDGDRYNNNRDNLRILCYNCHGQTDTWCRKKSATRARGQMEKPGGSSPPSKDNNLNASSSLAAPTCKCGKQITKGSKNCKSCTGKLRQPTKIDWPTIPELQCLLETSNYVKLSRELGVSDNAIRKRIKQYS